MPRLRVIPCPAADKDAAFKLAALGAADGNRDLANFIYESLKNKPLDGLFVAVVDWPILGSRLVGAMLSVLQEDGTAFAWPPHVASRAPQETAAALGAACREWIAKSGATIAQCVSVTHAVESHRLIEQAGFEHVTDATCWRHDLEEIPHAPLPEHCEVIEYSAETAYEFQRVMEQTFEDSQDCPALRGRRTAVDTLASRKLAGAAESWPWKIYQCDGENVGLVLCAEDGENASWELLYLGVTPKFRRHGFGLAMLCDALRDARDAGADLMFLAADDTNEAATGLYDACGFERDLQQRIHVWFPPRATG